MDCHEFKPLVAGYLRGKLEAELLNSFAYHMIECGRCEEYIFSHVEIASDAGPDEKGGHNNVL